MQQKTFSAIITVLALAVIIIPSAFAFGEFGGGGKKNFDPEKYAAIQEAFENKDYKNFQEVVTNLPNKRGKKITEEKFNEIVEKKAEMEASREATQDAIESGDYEEWKHLTEEKNPNNPLLEIITEDNFSKLKKLHALHEETKAIRKELGIDSGRFGADHIGHGKFGGSFHNR